MPSQNAAATLPVAPRVRVRLAASTADWAGAVAVRIAVFVDEQHIALSDELDEHDRFAVHAVATLADIDNDESRRALFALEEARRDAFTRAVALAGRYLPVRLAGARVAGADPNVLAPVVGTARLLGAAGGLARFGRLAVLPGWRRHGIGSRLLVLMEEAALARGAQTLLLHAQVRIEPFYVRHGYTVAEPRREFDEDGIPHVRMSKPLSVEM